VLTERVSQLIVDVADRVVMPRFRRLAPGEVAEKSPGDLVTIADAQAELEIAAALRAGDPGALVIGEEAVAADPSLRTLIDGGERVWLVDPVDGTGNFVAGNPDFGCMVVELRFGTPVRSWIWQAVRRRMFQAARGGGVHLDGLKLPRPRSRRSRLVGGVTAEYAELSGAGLAEPLPMTGSCTVDYPLIALDERDYLIHNGTYPWDHWPGILLLSELGGPVAFLDGEPFTSSSPNPHKILAARSPEVWDTVAAAVRDLDTSRS
jgi:fructose-1,6-bisphosphatase/inositol monophosphatase family enzyme